MTAVEGGPYDPDSRSRLASAVDEIALGDDAPPGRHSPLALAVDRFDREVDGLFEHIRGRTTPDAVFEAASRLGDWSLVWQLLNSAVAVQPHRSSSRFARTAVLLGVESVVVNQGVKRLFNRVRPEADPAVAARLRKPRTSSFPSGHASAAFTAAALITDGEPGLRPAVYAVALVVATSRIHTRMHHPSDVVGGALVGLGLGALFKRLWPVHD